MRGPSHASSTLSQCPPQTLTGDEALKIGLVSESVAAEEVLPRALALAQKIAANSPVAVRTCIQTLR